MRGACRQLAFPPPGRGFALLPVVLTLALLALSVLLLSNEAAFQTSLSATEHERERALYIAEAGLAHGKLVAQAGGCGPFTDVGTRSFGGGTYDVTVSESVPVFTISLSTSTDTWIDENNPSTAYASDAELQLQTRSGRDRRPMYKFDVSSIPATATVQSATLRLFVITPDNAGPVNVHSITADWNASSANWSNMSTQIDATVQATIPAAPAAGAFVDVPLTTLVQAWVDGSTPAYGVTLQATSTNVVSTYTSRDYGTGANRPQLLVTYSGGGGAQTVEIGSTGTEAGASYHVSEQVYGVQPAGSSVFQPGPDTLDTYLRGGGNSLS